MTTPAGDPPGSSGRGGRGRVAAVIVLVALAGTVFLLREALFDRTPRNLIVVVADTMRADHMGLYGYHRDTTPFLDSLASSCRIYRKAYSHYSYTWPTISNLFNGVPFSLALREGLFEKPDDERQTGGLVDANHTLAERLADRGFETRAVVANPFVNSRLRFAQGFRLFHDFYEWGIDPIAQGRPKIGAEKVNEIAFEWLRDLQTCEGPWFLYLHYFDPHSPYRAPEVDREALVNSSYDREGRVVNGVVRGPDGKGLLYLVPEVEGWIEPVDVRQIVDEYDAEVRHFDRAMRQLFQTLEELDMIGEVDIVITSDHGEAFYERKFWGHGFLSREEEERIPLIVWSPRLKPGRVDGVVTTTDIFHTVLDRCDAAGPPAQFAGTDRFVDLFGAKKGHAAVYTEGAGGVRILRTTAFSYYQYREMEKRHYPLPVENGDFLFDLEADPSETINLLEEDPAKAKAILDREFAEALHTHRHLMNGEILPDPMHDADGELAERLRALGYIE